MKRTNWEDLRKEVMDRDMQCIATLLDQEAGPCAGPITLDHVKCFLMMGKKAPDTARHLVSVCRGHHVDTRGGYQWATANRKLEREYLDSIYGPCTECRP